MLNKLTVLSNFKKIALFEGISYVLLLFFAMPLKYIFSWPLAVKYIGALHGALFIIYTILLVFVFYKVKWTLRKTIGAFVISIVPFAAFWFDKRLDCELKILKKS
jgi:integral membrane protein